MSASMSPNQRFFLGILIIMFVTIGSSFLVSPYLSVLLSVVFCILLWISRIIWAPAGYGANMVRLLCVHGVFAIAATYSLWATIVNGLVRTHFPQLHTLGLSWEPSGMVLGFILVALWIINRYLGDRSIAGNSEKPVDTYFPEKQFPEKLRSFCTTLELHLRELDQQTNWSPEYFVRLDAQVAVRSRNFALAKSKVTDLISAIRSDKKSEAFLVVGDPGSGKSVALRKLAQDMLREVRNQSRIPIYVNLREWAKTAKDESSRWTESNPPTIEDLIKFIIENIKARGDIFTANFVDQYFLKMHEHGLLFFILDSFDEIPQLLDVQEGSWLIDCLGRVFSRLIAGGNGCRCILASRLYRRPSASFQSSKTLEIRPFSETQISQAMARFPRFTEELRIALFKRRVDLMPIARNPLLMTLLGGWIEENGTLPRSQAEIYSGHAMQRLKGSAERMTELSVLPDEVLVGASKIAFAIFQSEFHGLEAPVKFIVNQPDCSGLEPVIEVLCHCRLARKGANGTFSFVHRRFLEYFVACSEFGLRSLEHCDAIPTDSRWREVLVLYAQIANPEHAQRLVNYCWQEIRLGFRRDNDRLRAIHCLRFLVDAYGGQPVSVASFAGELADLIENGIKESNDLVTAKQLLEAVSLIPESRAESILTEAIRQGNPWLQETAFRACRYIGNPGDGLEKSLEDYIWFMPLANFWRDRRSLLFSMSLSEGLSSPRRVVKIKSIEYAFVFSSMAIAIFYYPLLALIIAVLFSNIFLLNIIEDYIGRKSPHPRPSQAIEENPFQYSQSVLSFMYGGGMHNLDLFFRVIRPAFAFFIAIAQLPVKQTYHLSNESLLARHLLRPTWEAGGLTASLVFFVGILIAMPWTAALRERSRKVIFKVCLFAAVLGSLYVSNALEAWLFALGQLISSDAWYSVALKVLLLLSISIGVPLFIYQSARSAIALLIAVPKLLVEVAGDKRAWNKTRSAQFRDRSDIANSLLGLKTTAYRRKFIQLIADQQITPSGSWPSNFSLKDRHDPVMTELAKLEERWLGLD